MAKAASTSKLAELHEMLAGVAATQSALEVRISALEKLNA